MSDCLVYGMHLKSARKSKLEKRSNMQN